MDEIHVHKTKKSICAHFAESPCIKILKEHLLPYIAKNNLTNFKFVQDNAQI